MNSVDELKQKELKDFADRLSKMPRRQRRATVRKLIKKKILRLKKNEGDEG